MWKWRNRELHACKKMRWNLFWVCAFSYVLKIFSSKGDASPKFKYCLEKCKVQACNIKAERNEASVEPGNLVFFNQTQFEAPFRRKDLEPRFLSGLWSCKALCDYECMHRREKDENALYNKFGNRRKMDQYYGKWPFIRVFGMQEFFSVIFSLTNLASNFYGYKRLLLPLAGLTEHHPFRWTYDLYFVCHCLAWIGSAMYHTRDTMLTTHLDYYLSMLVSLATLYVTLLRVLNVQRLSQQLYLLAIMAIYYFRYVYSMTFVSFDYGYHVQLCILQGATSGLLWLSWYIYRVHLLKDAHVRGRSNILYFIVGAVLASLFEVYDFPPLLGLLDAHACWHACTGPLLQFWYSFLHSDLILHAVSLKKKDDLLSTEFIEYQRV